MEPFDLTLHQVTYEEGSDSPDELDSFGTVVNYDSHFSQVDTVPTTCSTPLTFTAATENRGINLIKFNHFRHRCYGMFQLQFNKLDVEFKTFFFFPNFPLVMVFDFTACKL